MAQNALHERIRPIWQQLANRNQWQLFADEEALFAQIQACLRELAATLVEAAIRKCIKASYSERMYQGLQQREERAAYEIWLMFLRLALKKGATEPDANDLAQEAMARVLAKLHNVQLPRAFIGWAIKVLITVMRDLRTHPERSLTNEHGLLTIDPPDLSDVLADVEGRILEEMFYTQLKEALPHELERLVVIRSIFAGDKPGDIANDLKMPSNRIRLLKSRGLQRLRENTGFVQILTTLLAGGNAND